MFGRNKELRRLINAQQNFHRAVRKIWDTMPDKEGLEFMQTVSDPLPIFDWDTGLEPGDPCPRHPDQRLSCFPPKSPIRLECFKCH